MLEKRGVKLLIYKAMVFWYVRKLENRNVNLTF